MENPKPSDEKNKKKPYLSTIGIIKSAIEIPLSSSTFFFFTFLTSLPYFFSKLLPRLMSFPFSSPSLLLDQQYYSSFSANNLNYDIALLLDFIFGFLTSSFFDFIYFILAITTVHSASKIYTAGSGSNEISLRNLVECSITKAKWHGMVTFLMMILFSTASLNAASDWGGYGPLVRSRTLIFQVVHGITFAAVYVIWSGFCAFLKLAVVLSFLEGTVNGLDSFTAAADLMQGNVTRGTILMVIDLTWRMAVGLPSLVATWEFPRGIAYRVVDEYLSCAALVLNWVVLVVYYYDCKNRRTKLAVEEAEPLVQQKSSHQFTFDAKKLVQMFGETL